MKSDLISVYDASSLAEAQMIASRLDDEGIQAFLDNTTSPLDGMVAAEQTIPVRVLPDDEERARAVVGAYQRESSDAVADDDALDA